MLITENIDIKINNRYVKSWIDKGYDVKSGDVINIPISELPEHSHYKIDVKCDICKSLNTITYQRYNINIKKCNYYCCKKCATHKYKERMLKKYGKSNPMYINKFKNKITKTNLEKYGVKYPSQNEEIYAKTIKTFRLKYGVDNISQSKYWRDKLGVIDKVGFEEYKRLVNNLTNRNKQELFEKWDGLDYYDNNIIKHNLNKDYNDKSYPTIDHKISVFYGFHNNISPENISSIKNLCITTRSNNSIKNRHNEYDKKI